MQGTKIKQENFKGISVDIYVTGRGQFNADVDGHEFTSETYEGLVAMPSAGSLCPYLRRVRPPALAIPR